MSINSENNIDHKSALVINGIMCALNVDHLFVDDDGVIKDSHIENMFDDLFYGRQFDGIFENNFSQYYGMLTGFADLPPQVVFDNVTQARRWVEKRFGKLDVSRLGPIEHDDELKHCKYRAVFVEPARHKIEAVYAPTKLHAILLCVVTVYRQLAQTFNDGRLIPTPGEIN